MSYISNHEVYLDFEETKTAFKKYGVCNSTIKLYTKIKVSTEFIKLNSEVQ